MRRSELALALYSLFTITSFSDGKSDSFQIGTRQLGSLKTSCSVYTNSDLLKVVIFISVSTSVPHCNRAYTSVMVEEHALTTKKLKIQTILEVELTMKR